MSAHVPASDGVRVATRDPEHHRAEHVMGTVVSLSLPAGGASSTATDAAYAWLHEVDRRFSPFRAESEVSRLMRGEIAAYEVSADLAEVLRMADTLELLSDGAFDIRRHRADGAPDPTGVVKGWAVERSAQMLAQAGIERFAIAAGGDVIVRGGEAPGRAWRIGVAHPAEAGAVALVLQAEDLAVATSGSAERGHHIVDARTGEAADELLSVSVAGPNLTRADGYATAAFAMGRAGLSWVALLPEYEAAGITHDGRLITTPGLDRYRP